MAFRPNTDTLRDITSGTWITAPPENWQLHRVDRLDIALRQKSVRDGLLLYSRNPEKDLKRLKTSKLNLDGAVLLTATSDFDEAQVVSQLRVTDVDDALRAIGTGARDEFPGKVVAITGSVGKTTTKNLLAHTLAEHCSVYVKLDNQNGFRSILNRLLQLGSEDIAVFEVARIALPGSSFILKPDIAIITAIAEAHMSALDSLENTAKVKASIFRGMPPNGTAIINADTHFADTLVSTALDQGCKVMTYSNDGPGDIFIEGYDPASRTVQAKVANKSVTYKLNLLGRHNALNSLSVLAVIESLGKNLEDHLPAMETFLPVQARGTSIETTIGGRSVLLVDDSYNANPTSMIASLEGFKENFSDRRRILVLGDMLELGPREESFHAELVEHVRRVQAAQIYLVGPLMKNLFRLLPDTPPVTHVASPESLLHVVPQELKDGDAILLKASNGTGLGTLVRGWTAPTRPPSSWRFTVGGNVQGTGYRRWIRKRAKALQVDGWIRNRSDGRVEGLIHGDRAVLSDLIGDIHDGPPSSGVTRVTTKLSTIKPRKGFRIRKDIVIGNSETQPKSFRGKILHHGKRGWTQLLRGGGLKK